MEILSKLFGSDARVRILRLFFLNRETGFELIDVARKTKTNAATARKEIKTLISADIIKRHKFRKDEAVFRGKIKRRKVSGFIFNKHFSYRDELKDLLISTDIVKKNEIMKRFRHAGQIKFLLISGIFIKDETGEVDILIVGDRLRRGSIENTVSSLEAEVGKDLRYAALDTADFRYRLEMRDKFVRDIMDYPHETVIDRLGLEK